MTTLTQELEQVGDALVQACRRDLQTSPKSALKRHRRLVLGLAIAATVIGAGAAIGAGALKTIAEEERGLLDGHALFQGSDPTCAALTAVSFRCTLEKPPTGMAIYESPPGQSKYEPDTSTRLFDKFLGAKMQTVDATLHIDGGCISRRADGRTWDCYLGEEAVRRDIIGPDLLGAYQPEPARG
jgi:hypothetical protein